MSCRSADLRTSLRGNLAWWAVTQRTLKTHSKFGGGRLHGYSHLLGTIRYVHLQGKEVQEWGFPVYGMYIWCVHLQEKGAGSGDGGQERLGNELLRRKCANLCTE